MRCMCWPCLSMVGWGPGVPGLPGIQGLARGAECVPQWHSTWSTCVMLGRILASSCTSTPESFRFIQRQGFTGATPVFSAVQNLLPTLSYRYLTVPSCRSSTVLYHNWFVLRCTFVAAGCVPSGTSPAYSVERSSRARNLWQLTCRSTAKWSNNWQKETNVLCSFGLALRSFGVSDKNSH